MSETTVKPGLASVLIFDEKNPTSEPKRIAITDIERKHFHYTVKNLVSEKLAKVFFCSLSI